MKMMSTGWEETETKEYKFRKTKETKFKNQTGMWLSLGELFDIFKKLDLFQNSGIKLSQMRSANYLTLQII